jgi:hypothetical protein
MVRLVNAGVATATAERIRAHSNCEKVHLQSRAFGKCLSAPSGHSRRGLNCGKQLLWLTGARCSPELGQTRNNRSDGIKRRRRLSSWRQ